MIKPWVLPTFIGIDGATGLGIATTGAGAEMGVFKDSLKTGTAGTAIEFGTDALSISIDGDVYVALSA